MRRVVSILCLLAMVPLVMLFVRVSGELPAQTSALVQEKYTSWSGVLRLWIYEGWDANASGWLNRAIASFEKQNSGVYVQPRYVDAAAIVAFASSGVNPPEMILFPPGLLSNTDDLMELGGLPMLKNGLAESGDGYAVPVLMGAYGWAYNRLMLDGLPATWEGVELACAPATEFVGLPAALTALCSGVTNIEPALPDLDLGLPVSADIVECRLPEGFALCETAYSDFINGRAAAIPVTQKDVRRLRTLSDAGRGPDWVVSAAGNAMFADQLLFFSVVDWPREDQTDRQALCLEFLALLLSEDTQSDLDTTGAFPVIETGAIYANSMGYAALETASSMPLLVPNAFTKNWRDASERVAQEFIAGRISAQEGLSQIQALLATSGNQ